MNDAVTTTTQLWEKIMQGDIKAFTFSDVIWAIGVVVIIVLAVKIGYKMAKVILILLLIAVIVFYLISQGVIPLK
ncbi:MAG: hypothetical protein AB1Z23_00820 [Eubacteriales bacterium]